MIAAVGHDSSPVAGGHDRRLQLRLRFGPGLARRLGDDGVELGRVLPLEQHVLQPVPAARSDL